MNKFRFGGKVGHITRALGVFSFLPKGGLTKSDKNPAILHGVKRNSCTSTHSAIPS